MIIFVDKMISVMVLLSPTSGRLGDYLEYRAVTVLGQEAIVL
ncbi:MAG TPA: hypothetical protein VIY53_17765 [Acidobacteriaceae bacterium]